MKKKTIIKLFLIIQLIIGGMLISKFNTNQTPLKSSSIETNKTFFDDDSSMDLKLAAIYYENVTVISDKWEEGTPWNTDSSDLPKIYVDILGNLHAVWNDRTPGVWGGGTDDREIMYANFTVSIGQWSNVTVISDKWQDGSQWNTGESSCPDITMDYGGNIHIVWNDDTPGIWGGGSDDFEIMYANYSVSKGQWSNATVISDGYNDEWGWNTQDSASPEIIADGSGNLHVVWIDHTPGVWGGGYGDYEIMYANYSVSKGQWSNATVISDGYKDEWGWNTGDSRAPKIVVDNSGNLHVVWEDWTPGAWGSGGYDDSEIMYANYSATSGQWSNVTVISDKWEDGTQWNIESSDEPDIAVDSSNNLHVVWQDETPGLWGGGASDYEIMYANYSAITNQWSNATVISDKWEDGTTWNIGKSWHPKISINNSGDLHVVWEDETYGAWGGGDDSEIMYTNFMINTGKWSNATVISDKWQDGSQWNTGESYNPEIAIDQLGNLHVVWEDWTPGPWKDGIYDSEIMYTKIIIDNNAPSVSIKSPTIDIYDSTSLLINASIYDIETSVVNAKAMINATTPFNISLTSTMGNYWSCNWDNISEYTDGDYKIIVWATDDAGNINQTIFVIITIDRYGPNVSINTPKTGVYGSDSLVINATIRDLGTGVADAKAMINATIPFNISMNLSLENNWVCLWDNTSKYDNGYYNITIWSIDELGRITQSEYVVISIYIPPTNPSNGGDDDDDDSGGNDDSSILGYAFFILFGAIALTSLILILRRLRTSNFFKK